MEQLLDRPGAPGDPLEALQSALPDAAADEVPHAVVVRLAGARYAVAMDRIAEVVAVPALTRVPQGPRWLSGVANWRGRILAVVDLRPLVGAEQRPLPTSSRLIVLSWGGVEAGLLCESVVGLLAPGPVVGQPPSTVTDDAAALVSGVVDDGSGPVSLLDVPAVLALRHRLGSA